MFRYKYIDLGNEETGLPGTRTNDNIAEVFFEYLDDNDILALIPAPVISEILVKVPKKITPNT